MWHSLDGIIMRRSEDTNQWNKIVNSIFRIAFRSPRGHWVKQQFLQYPLKKNTRVIQWDATHDRKRYITQGVVLLMSTMDTVITVHEKLRVCSNTTFRLIRCHVCILPFRILMEVTEVDKGIFRTYKDTELKLHCDRCYFRLTYLSFSTVYDWTYMKNDRNTITFHVIVLPSLFINSN